MTKFKTKLKITEKELETFARLRGQQRKKENRFIECPKKRFEKNENGNNQEKWIEQHENI